MSVFNKNNVNHRTSSIFLGEELGAQRYDEMKHRAFDNFTNKQLSFYWRPEEVEISKDAKDFKMLSQFEKHIFTSNLKRQTLLDSVQGRSPNLAFLPIATIPEMESWLETWAFSETIHSRSYTYILKNVYSNPSKILDELMDIPQITECSDSITAYYDSLVEAVGYYKLLGEGRYEIKDKVTQEKKYVTVSEYDIKRKIWLAVMAVTILEGIRFYVSFACSWAFAELKKMEGNAKIIKLICRDENLHLAAMQTLLKLLPKDDPDFAKIKEETADECSQMFLDAMEQEKDWAGYLFKDGSMIGLNEQLLVSYIEWITHKRMKSAGFKPPFTALGSNPLPWTHKWINGGEVQVAPQEVAVSSYTIGAVNMDIQKGQFKDFEL